MPRILSLIAVLAITTLCSAQEASKTLAGILFDSNSPRIARELTGATLSEPVNQSVRFMVPRWDGKNAAGQFIGYERLRRVRLEVVLNLDTHQWGENIAPSASGWWQVTSGVAAYWSRRPIAFDDPTVGGAFGGARPMGWTDAAESTPAFDGTVDGQGASGHYRFSSGQHGFSEELWISNASASELRKWAGPTGSMVEEHLNVRAYGDPIFSGHWPEWGVTTFSVADMYGWPVGTKVLVTYFYATSVEPTVLVQTTPWLPMPTRMIEPTTPPMAAAISGFVGNPAQLRDVLVETNFAYWLHFAIENTSSIAGICGGQAAQDVKLEGPYGAPFVNTTMYASIGSGNSFVGAFDGTIDFSGSSGMERYARQAWTSAGSWRQSVHGWAPLNAFANQPVPLMFHTPAAVGNATPVTPGTSFAWWHHGALGGRSRIVYFLQP